jgi:hypothetical protein
MSKLGAVPQFLKSTSPKAAIASWPPFTDAKLALQ